MGTCEVQTPLNLLAQQFLKSPRLAEGRVLLAAPVSTHGSVEVGYRRQQMAVCHTWAAVQLKQSCHF